ncbi:MAG TPA: hypothetical protein VE994_05620, partial [Terriglobales bacterium]|nr:hypothetical protein [Terriglobales bacterium]
MAREFSFVCEGRECTGIGEDFDLIGAGESRNAKGRSLTVRLHHRSLSLEVAVVYSVFDGQPALRKHLVLRNTGGSALHLTHMSIEAIGVALGAADEMTLLTQYGSV